MPEHRIRRVVRFNTADLEYPPAHNVLHTSNHLEYETMRAEMLMVLKRLFNSNAEFGLMMEWILRTTVRTLLVSERVKTLYDVSSFPENSSYQSQVLDSVRDRELRRFWRNRNLISERDKRHTKPAVQLLGQAFHPAIVRHLKDHQKHDYALIGDF